jgi:phage gp29-like protein
MAEKPPSSEIPRARRARRHASNEAVSAIPPTVISIFNNAASTGDTSRQTRFYKDARILDSRLDTVCATRTLAIQGRPLVFKPPPGFEGDAEAKRIAQNCTRLWNSTRRTVGALGHLAHGVLEGHAPFMSTIRDGAVQVYKTEGAAPELIEVRGGFAEVGDAGLTVLAEHVEV